MAVIDDWADLLRGWPHNEWPTCDTHETHHRVWNRDLEMWLFDDERYLNTPEYCPGDDDVSRTLRLYGVWEPTETRSFIDVLERTPGIVIDMGAQIGWYSRLARKFDRPVLAIEPVGEHIEMLRENAPGVTIARHWIDGTSPVLPVAKGAPDVAIVKMDVEGNEVDCVRMISALIRAGKVANILMEVSPVFNRTYEAIIPAMMQWGYTAEVCNPFRPFEAHEIAEVLAAAPQVDMMFRKVA